MNARVVVSGLECKWGRHIVDSLENAGFHVIVGGPASLSAEQVVNQFPTVIVIEGDAIQSNLNDFLERLRHRNVAGIIVIGAGSYLEAIDALLHGADMYVNRSVALDELVHRIRVLARAAVGQSDNNMQIITESVCDNILPEAVRSNLTTIEARLLTALWEREHCVVTHDELMTQAWGRPVKRETLRWYVCQLRKKIENNLCLKVLTQSGVGYRLVHSE